MGSSLNQLNVNLLHPRLREKKANEKLKRQSALKKVCTGSSESNYCRYGSEIPKLIHFYPLHASKDAS
eukprot:c54225_g1_i1 orf=104-307(-)